MSESQIEELTRRSAILIERDDNCVSMAGELKDFVFINLGNKNGIHVDPVADRLCVTYEGDAYYRASDIIMYHDELKVEEVLKILRLRTVLDELSDV